MKKWYFFENRASYLTISFLLSMLNMDTPCAILGETLYEVTNIGTLKIQLSEIASYICPDPLGNIPKLGTCTEASFGLDVNNLEQVVGNNKMACNILDENGEPSGMDFINFPFHWTAESGIVRASEGSGTATAINNMSENVGINIADCVNRFGVIRNQQGGITDLGYNVQPRGINDKSNVAGLVGSGEAFIWTEADGLLDLGTLCDPEGLIGFAASNDINNQTQIVGSSSSLCTDISAGRPHAFLWTEQDGMRDLGTLGGDHSFARAINELGQVVGSSDAAPFTTHAFLWTEQDGMRDLGEFEAYDINYHGEIVGYSGIGDNTVAIYFKDGQMYDLNDLIASDSDWEIKKAKGINDKGQITGHGEINGEIHAFLLTPVPESICGNGIVEADEQCDDGNTRNGDCCSANCTFESDGNGGARCAAALPFKCYFGKQKPPFAPDNPPLPFPVANVQLNDQFQSRLYAAIFLQGLCSSAVEDSVDPIPREDPRLLTYQTCYKVRPLSNQDPFLPPTVTIQTVNFGDDSFKLGQPRELCQPAVKNGRGSIEGAHYLCYTASSPLINETVTIDDQFGREEVVVTKLDEFCVPVGKNEDAPVVEEDADDPRTWQHLACYDIRELSGPKLPIDVTVADWFTPDGGVRQTVEKPRRICEPARKAAVIPRLISP